jgi:hypothetical protein
VGRVDEPAGPEVRGEDQHRRYVLRYRGQGAVPGPDVARIEREVEVLDRAPRLLLVQTTRSGLAHLLAGLPRWIAADERGFALPDVRPRVERPA